MIEITLRLSDGQKKTFSEQELIAIVEEHLQSKKLAVMQSSTGFVSVPTEGKCFSVNPLIIDQNLFKRKREDLSQENTRQLILEAFEEMKKYPEKYAKSFKTVIPEKTWGRKTIGELRDLAGKLGKHNADWVEQALEWAQRIDNGEEWENICNNNETAKWNRLVVWKNGYARLVGGSHNSKYPASTVSNIDYYDHIDINYVVPLVVL